MGLVALPWRPVADASGGVVPGAQLYFTAAGSDVKAPIYTDDTYTVERLNPLSVDAAGKFPITHTDPSVNYRLRIYARGATPGVDTPIEEYDPYVPGVFADASALSPVAAAAEASAAASASSAADAAAALAALAAITSVPSGWVATATRVTLAALADHSYPAVLAESKRTGIFVWSSANLAAPVAADPYQGIYVAPASDTSGASGAWVRQIVGPWLLSWFGFVNGCTAAAARFESAIALGYIANGRSGRLMLPNEEVALDTEVRVDYPVFVDGYGKGPSRATSGSVLTFGGGNNLFHIRNNVEAGNGIGGSGSVFSGFWAEQTSASAAQGAGAYDGAQAVTLTSGNANFANRQNVLVEGATTPLTLPDRTFHTTNGNVAITQTVTASDYLGGTPYFGNRIGYEGMHVTGSGIPAGATLATLGIAGAATLSAAPTATNDIALTVVPPIISQIQSGGGTANLTIDNPSYGVACSGRVVRHCPAAFYITTGHVTVADIIINMPLEGAGGVVRGHTSDGSIADSCKFSRVHFLCYDFNLVFEGSDAQRNAVEDCTFDFAKVHILDNSAYGQGIENPLFTFNVAIMVLQLNAQTTIDKGYLESGTTWFGPQLGMCAAYDVVSMVNGSGFTVMRTKSGDRVMGRLSAEGVDVWNGLAVRGNTHTRNYCNYNGGSPVVGVSVPAGIPYKREGQTGVTASGGLGYFTTYQSSVGYEPDHREASEFSWGFSFTAKDMLFNSSGLNISSGKVYKIAGTQVVGAQKAALPADATDLATALTLVNAIKARMKVTGGHGLVAD